MGPFIRTFKQFTSDWLINGILGKTDFFLTTKIHNKDILNGFKIQAAI